LREDDHLVCGKKITIMLLRLRNAIVTTFSLTGLWAKMLIQARSEVGHCHQQEGAKEKEACPSTCPCRG